MVTNVVVLMIMENVMKIVMDVETLVRVMIHRSVVTTGEIRSTKLTVRSYDKVLHLKIFPILLSIPHCYIFTFSDVAPVMKYMGCFRDQLFDRDLPARSWSSNSMTLELCASHCEGYTYMATQVSWHNFSKLFKAINSRCDTQHTVLSYTKLLDIIDFSGMINVDVETLMENMDLMTTDVMIHVMVTPLRDVEAFGGTQSTRSNMVRSI